MMLDKVIEPDSLRAVGDSVTLGLRLPWYRTLPLSTIEIDAVKIDGRPFDRAHMQFALNGRQWPVDAMKNLTSEGWFVTDTATLNIEGLKLAKGSTHHIEVTVSIYPPYIRGTHRAVRWAREMEVR